MKYGEQCQRVGVEVIQCKLLQIFPWIRKLDVINPSSSTVYQCNLSPVLMRDKDGCLKKANHLTNSIIFVFPILKEHWRHLHSFFSDQVYFVWNDKHLNGESKWSRPKLQSSIAKQPSWRNQNKACFTSMTQFQFIPIPPSYLSMKQSVLISTSYYT